MSSADGLPPATAGPPPVPASPGEQPAPLGRGTLGRQLVIRVTALVALAAILLGGATALATRQLLINQLDRQIDAALNRQQQFRTGGHGSWDPSDQGRPPGGVRVPGQQIGTLAAEFVFGEEPSIGVLRSDDADLTLDRRRYAALVDQLQAVPVDGEQVSVRLTEPLGRYRLVAQQRSYGTVVVGLPLTDVDNFIAELVALELALTLLAVAGAALAARAVVLRSLRPLNRVAATAQQVSQLPLDRGEVALAVRVPPADANPSSEIGRVGLALNHMLNNVEDALAARQASETKVRRFVADASHELRNPLAAIRGYAELTRRSRDEIPEDAAYAMSRVESEAERMSRLVEDLLLLARLDSGPDLEIGPTDLTALVINAVSDARAAGPQHVWQLSLPELPVVAVGDRHRLHQVVVNLLANARTHTPAGTRVETRIEVRQGQAVIEVSDDGPGIPEEIRHQVFERFTRADTSRVRAAGAASGTSTGLGLAIVAAVVEAHHGRVTVASRPGQTTFSVWLPLASFDPTTEPAEPTTPHPFAPPPLSR
nr:HAMP domain-containing sensor histidine kinase [uncultured Friedmanniella sp.]